MFRLFRWTRDFNYTKVMIIVPVWVKLPQLPLIYFNPAYLKRRIGNSIGTFLRADDKTLLMQNIMQARIYLEIDVSKPLQYNVWIGESKEKGFWQKVEYEGNNAFCTHCGLLGHVKGVCRKIAENKPQGKVQRPQPRYPILKRGQNMETKERRSTPNQDFLNKEVQNLSDDNNGKEKEFMDGSTDPITEKIAAPPGQRQKEDDNGIQTQNLFDILQETTMVEDHTEEEQLGALEEKSLLLL